jgi:hypothetical protein
MSYLDIVKLRQKKISEFLGVGIGVKKVDSAGHYIGDIEERKIKNERIEVYVIVIHCNIRDLSLLEF